MLGDGGRSGECKSTITPTPNLKSCSKTEGEPSCYGKVPGTVCATGRVCVWSGTGQCECALTPTGTPTPTTPTSSCWGVCVVPQSFTCSDFNMVNSTGSCSNGARCCKPVAVTITPTSGAPTATRMPTNPPRQYCYCDGNCGLGDCIWSASATGNYGRRCDDNWCQGIPTATPTPRTFCYCAVNCGIGDCAWLPTASGIYGRRCTVDDCQGIPTPTSGPIATRTPTPTVPYIPNPTAISTPLPTLQPGSACRVDADCGGATKSGCAVQCVTEYCPGNSGCGKTEGTAGALNCQLYPPAGTVWNSNYSACVTSGVVPTGGPPPPPTGGPAPSTCQYQSLQARVQIDSSHDWQTQLTIGSNDSVNLGCMADSTGQLASNVKLVAEYSDGSKQEFNTNLESDWKPSKTGNYTIWCQSTDTTCSGLTSSTNATLKVGGACKECPNDFHCYGPDEDNISLGYAWFATGYVMEGYAAQVPDEYCTDSGLVKPQWIGKGSGDANCDGQINTYDFSLWNKEFDESNGEEVVSSDWEADFTGPEGVCDGIVDTYDFSLWNRSYIELEGGNN